jgi:hypothetical protein
MKNDYIDRISVESKIPKIEDIKVAELSLDKTHLLLGCSVKKKTKNLPVLIINISDFLITRKRNILSVLKNTF